MSERNGVDVNRLVLRPEAEANKEFLVKVIKLNDWFIAHQLSAYRGADQKTKDHLDKLYLEFNRRWQEIISQNSVISCHSCDYKTSNQSKPMTE